ncbi:MAG: sugar ABC transporter permease [Oscillospiraceae bacterium]|nr:sugar ABC transporter permease [Oscillospiraceae bacterium]
MIKKLTFRQFLFLVPLLIIIAVFSIWPILTSFTYSFFDYQLNNIQKSQLSFSGTFSKKQFEENSEYVKLFLSDDANAAAGNAKAEQAFQEALADAENYCETFSGFPSGKISASQSKEFTNSTEALRLKVKQLYLNFPNEKYANQESLPMIFEELNKAISPSNFTGLSGYRMIFGDQRLFDALGHTVYFTLISVAIEFLLGLGLALIMNKAVRGIGLIRAGALIPWAIPTAVSALMWSYLYDGSNGIIAHIFAELGLISSSETMLLTGPGAMWAAILTDVWKTTPYMALLLLAGLQVIDKGLYESSAIDGANRIQTFFKITLPLLKPSILVAVLFRTLDAFRVYDLIAVLTGGGPGGATETLSVYAYKTMFSQMNFGYGSVIVMFMFVCVLIIATLFIKVLGANVMTSD